LSVIRQWRLSVRRNLRRAALSARQIIFLRGINLGATNRIAMPALREALSAAGFDEVRTYLQSGNAVVGTKLAGEKLVRACERLILDQFGLRIDVVVRSRDELAAVVERNPLKDVAENPKRYQVTFLSAPVEREVVDKLRAAADSSERLVADGLELYAWHPKGVARSKLWGALAGKGLGVKATARNWTTVTSLLELADAS
jgi:uncharacterized protein (DUF1697 family)